MGMFDDLIPSESQQKAVTFEDLAPAERVMSGVKLPDWMMALGDARDSLRGTAVEGVSKGMLNPFVGAVQGVANLTGMGDGINKEVTARDARYEAARKAQGRDGFDAAQFVGEVASPFNYALAKAVPMAQAATTLGRAKLGAVAGGAASAAQPVVGAEDGSYFGDKAWQLAVGVGTGAVLSPAIGAVADKAVPFISRVWDKVTKGFESRIPSGAEVEREIIVALREVGQDIREVPPEQIAALRDQVTTALAKGQKLDAAGMMRKADFEALGMEPTLGQINRDPMQFAREKNLRGVENLGEPLSARFSTQGNQLTERMGNLSRGAKNTYQAGEQLTTTLKSADDAIKGHVSGLYNEARASAGKDLDVPLQGFAQDYAKVLEQFGPENIPGAIRSRLASYGIDPLKPGNQTKVFTLEEANALSANLNDFYNPGNPTQNKALGKLKEAIRGAVNAVDETGGPFAPAVKAAKGRFDLQDAVPALKAVADGDIAPDDFVRRFIINGKTKDVKELAGMLKAVSPEAHQEARKQMGEELRLAAFGDNVTGDKAFAPDRYMKAIRRIGLDKLSAFFNAQEVNEILTVGRVGAYIHQAPNASAVNSSNTAGAIMNLASRIPGVPAVVGMAKSASDSIKNRGVVTNALKAQLEPGPVPMSDEQRRLLDFLMMSGALGGGVAGGAAIGR